MSHGNWSRSSASTEMESRLRQALAVCFLSIVGLTIISLTSPADALAAETHPYTGVSFGPDGTEETTFTRVDGVAVDQASELVYVYDGRAAAIYKFDLAGKPAPFSSTGSNVITGVGGTPENGALEIAVAPAGAPGGTAGDIYVATNASIVIYNPAGESIGTLSTGTPPCGVATNTAGNLFAGVYPSEVREYVPSANPPTAADLQATSTASLPEICNVAADGLGNVYAANYEGSQGVVRLEGLGAATATPIDPTAISIAVDPGTNDLYAASSNGFRQYSSSGTLLSVSGTGRLMGSQGIAVDSATETVYVGNESNLQVDIFGPSEVLVPGATIVSSSAVEVRSTEATLEAVINPKGEATSYQIEYGLNASYGLTTPAKFVGETEALDRVTTTIKGLTPGTTYHWRVVATSSVAVTGSDHTFTTSSSGGSGPETCANQVFRIGPSAQLPDCRAYELVSPLDKGGMNIEPGITVLGYRAELNSSSLSGDALTYTTTQGFANPSGAPYARQYLAKRLSSGWANQSIASTQTNSRFYAGQRIEIEYRIFTPDLCTAALLNFSEPALVQPASDEAPNIYKRELCNGGVLRSVSATPHTTRPEAGGITPDGRCALYFPELFLSDRSGLHENCDGVVRRIDILPGGTPTEGLAMPGTALTGETTYEASLRFSTMAGSLSLDGSTVYWYDAGSDPGSEQLFVRVHADREDSALVGGECVEPAKACTLPVSELAEGKGAEFAAASTDGSRAYFYYRTTGTLYEYNLNTQSVQALASGLSVPAEPGKEGETWAMAPVVGVSEDGSQLYFGSTEEINGEGTPGQLNLYLRESPSPSTETIHLVASMPLAENTYFQEYSVIGAPYLRTARVSSDGSHLVFATSSPLTAYDNRAVGSGEPAVEVYMYDAPSAGGAGALTCLSCNPSGKRPQARTLAPFLVPFRNQYAATIPGSYTSLQASRPLSADGDRLFFDSYDALVPQDSNGKADVYEWTRNGTHGCTAQSPSFGSSNGGCLDLISTGQNSNDSKFIDASSDGRDVFFATEQSLVTQDPGLIDIYDARIDGGFPQASTPPAPCEGQECQSPPGASAPRESGTAKFMGPGNPAHKKKCGGKKQNGKKQKGKKQSKCLKQHKQKKKHHKGAKGKRAQAKHRQGNSAGGSK